MEIMFLEAVDISEQYEFSKGTVLQAEECGDYIAIRMPDDATAMAPKSAIGEIFEILEV